MFFFDGRQMKHNCYQFGLRSDVGASFETAIQDSESVETYEEVGEVFVPRIGDMRVKNWKRNDLKYAKSWKKLQNMPI